MTYDILLVAMPLLSRPESPPAGIYSLKPWLEQNGYTVKCVDGYSIGHDVDKIVEEINKYDFNWIGISVFSPYEVDLAIEVAFNYDKVIFGGTGVHGNIKKLWEEKKHIGESHFVFGEGEYALIELLKGNSDYPGIDGREPEQILNIDDFPAPDYSDVKDNYRVFTITGSRGCVRKCSFCNVPLIWKKFVWTDGEKLAKNLISVHEKCVGSDRNKIIQMSDSLINGNDKSLIQMCDYLINTKVNVPWTGQIIVKDRSYEYFQKMVKAGAVALNLGVESFSHETRLSMNKKFTDEVLFNNIDYLMKAGLRHLYVQLIVGYPDETEFDFFKITPFLKRYQSFNNRISVVPSIMVVDEETPVGKIMDDTSFYKFVCENHDFNERVRRYLILVHLLEKYGYELDPQTFPQKIAEIKTEIGMDEYNRLNNEANEVSDKWMEMV